MDAIPLVPEPTLEHYAALAAALRAVHADDAEEVLARRHGFDSWVGLAAHVEGMLDPRSPIARYEAAADAVVDGDLDALRALVDADPSLARATSSRRHHATLLHYVAANGVEDFRQRTPPNIVDIARYLLGAGAEVDAPNADYGGDGTALGLVATSIHPCNAGVQLALLELLVTAGASLEGIPGAWRPMDAAVANGCPDAARWLADRGARMTIIAAAALGHLDRVVSQLDAAPPAEREQAFTLAAGYGHTRIAELLLDRGVAVDAADGRALRWARAYGHDDTVAMLLARGAS